MCVALKKSYQLFIKFSGLAAGLVTSGLKRRRWRKKLLLCLALVHLGDADLHFAEGFLGAFAYQEFATGEVKEPCGVVVPFVDERASR